MTGDARTIGTKTYTTAYDYDAANRIAEIVYPSGRIVNYWRDAEGRITSVTTKQDALAAQETLVSNIGYQPMSSIVQALDYGNGLNIWNTFTSDYEIDVLGVYDGAAAIINRAHTRTDDLNLTNVWDNVVTANNQSYWYTATNRLQNADGPWGDLTFYSDGVGNRTYRILDDGATTTTQTFGYPALTNLIGDEDTGGVTTRTFTHDAAGNMTRDVRSATTYDYVINNAGRISQVKINSVVSADYEYNAQNQLVFRSTTVAGGPSGDMHYVYDRQGHLIAEADAATGTTVREYVWLADMPIAVVADVDTASPVIYYVHVDHLNRPVMMTDGLKANVWEAVWLPFGAIHSITGTASNDARFPGQRFQIETGLHYNWHRHYDPTLARYTQADPLGFVDGPSVFAYAKNSPQMYVDPDGRDTITFGGSIKIPFLGGVHVAVGASFPGFFGGEVDFGLLGGFSKNEAGISAKGSFDLQFICGSLLDQKGASAQISALVPLTPAFTPAIGGSLLLPPNSAEALCGCGSEFDGFGLSVGTGVALDASTSITGVFSVRGAIRDIQRWLK